MTEHTRIAIPAIDRQGPSLLERAAPGYAQGGPTLGGFALPPMPVLPYESAPGRAFAAATRSGSERSGDSATTKKVFGSSTTLASQVKSAVR